MSDTTAALRLGFSAVVLTALLLAAPGALAGVTFYTSEAAWEAAVGAANVESFETTDANVGLAAQLGGPPGDNAQMGPQLDFHAPDIAPTGVCGPFTLRAMETGAQLVHDDTEGSGLVFVADSISIGDVDNHETDSFRFSFPTQAFYAFGFRFVDSTSASDEGLLVMGAQGRIGLLPGTEIPSSTGNGQQFVGMLSTEPIHAVFYTEGAGADDIAIRSFRFACARLDPDADGLSNAAELAAGTDPNVPDTDGDGLLDGEELGTGSFGPPQNVGNGGGSVQTADIDGDGDLDVVTTWRNQSQINWWRNNGAGDFLLGQSLVGPVAFQTPEFAGAADLDGDGDLDVAVLGGGILQPLEICCLPAVWKSNLGAGVFSSLGSGIGMMDLNPNAAVASVLGDWDADGDVDAVTINPPVSYRLRNDGSGAFDQSTSIQGTHAVAVADLNLDGGLESVTAIDTSSDFIVSSLGSISTSVSAPRSVAVSDLDGDGDVDVASASASDDKIAWYPNTGAGAFGSQQVVSTAADGASAVFAADLDRDGDVDLLSTSSTDGEVAWYENADGLGGFGSQQVLHAAAGAAAVHAADLDGDGDLDVLAGFEVGTSSSTTSWFEQLNVADPTDPDTDGDLMLDGFEVDAGLDPYDPADAAADADSDGLDNLGEQLAGTDPLDPDTDGDGSSDGDEILAGTDPLDDQSFPPPAVPALTPVSTLLLIALLAAIPARRLRRVG